MNPANAKESHKQKHCHWKMKEKKMAFIQNAMIRTLCVCDILLSI